jgi:hypothetical protein
MDAWRAALEQAGEEQVIVSLLTYLFTEVLDGRNARVTDGVRQALGREPTDFSEFARRTAVSGVWTPPSAA